MSSVNSKTISASVLSTTTAINLGHTITAGDSDAYTMEITFTDVTGISGTCQMHFTLPDGTYADRDNTDGITIVGNKVSYLLPEEVYSQRGMVLYVQFLNSNLYTPLKVTFSGIRTVPGTTPLYVTQSYPTWAADVITDIAEMSDGNTGTANQVWTSDGSGDASWQSVAGAGLGDVTGPAGATDGNIALFDGVTGKVIKNSTAKPSDFAAASHTQAASTITDFDTEVGNHADVSANTSARHSHANAVALAAVTNTNTGDQDLSGYALGAASATAGNLPSLDATGKVLSDSGFASIDLLKATDAVASDPLLDSANIGYDVILIMGQSNASGEGEPINALYDYTDPRVLQYPDGGAYSGKIILAIDPMYPCTNQAIGFALTFGKQHIMRIPSNRKALIVNCARGATSYGAGDWVVGGDDYLRAVSTANAVLALSATNRLLTMVWIHGESDAGASMSGATYQGHLDTMIAGLRSAITGAANCPFVIGGMVPERVLGTTADIRAVQADTPNRLLYTAYVAGPSNPTDTTHYTAASQRILGVTLYAGLATALANV